MITLLDPANYLRTPWKNGGGTTVDIAFSGDVWRFGRTPIVQPGPFSDYTGYDRIQVLVSGSGLVLETPEGEIDVRQPFRPVHFTGETRIASRLEAGPVEVVNLIGARAQVKIDIAVLDEGRTLHLQPGIHIAYSPHGEATVAVQDDERRLASDHALRLDITGPTRLSGRVGCLLVGSITAA
ncbi:HutD/Ves family protein [Reyranella sp.]|uniref:HutD/Ves family protein n=1 Tax=Reyranella sp. TaxID=1929291 RepID=UPI003D138F08